MAGNTEQVRAKLNQASSTQVKNGKDATKSTKEFVEECRKAGGVLAEFADRLEKR